MTDAVRKQLEAQGVKLDKKGRTKATSAAPAPPKPVTRSETLPAEVVRSEAAKQAESKVFRALPPAFAVATGINGRVVFTNCPPRLIAALRQLAADHGVRELALQLSACDLGKN
ncbi:hypothetical protein [Solirubrum puertoriconensis]|uniref:Uncharacterized protein n=1 Tax=Solirubrum puertoriconensis TaxID=1751427 RepID=A0A9X0HJ99_SOLP1|nr:hypothetical protein [Solirubrum puertoriconensis]KUG06901.1 hypothetical protein ASU33_06135 [Solirubrum puertoriconensis]